MNLYDLKISLIRHLNWSPEESRLPLSTIASFALHSSHWLYPLSTNEHLRAMIKSYYIGGGK